jgi:hypothetical protein
MTFFDVPSAHEVLEALRARVTGYHLEYGRARSYAVAGE